MSFVLRWIARNYMHAVEGSRVGHSATERSFEVLSFSCLSPCVFVLILGALSLRNCGGFHVG